MTTRQAVAKERLKKCPHKHYEIIWDNSDLGYYVECRDCWEQFPTRATKVEAYVVFMGTK